MTPAPLASMEVQAELRSPSAQVQLVRYQFGEAPSSVMRLEDTIRIELCLSTRHRTARAHFPDRWSRNRFERIGDLFALPPTIDAHVRSDEQAPLDSVLCQFELPPVLALFDRLPDLDDRFLMLALDVRDANVRQGLLRLAEETRHPGFASQILVESITAQVSVDLLRYGAALPERSRAGSLAAWQQRKLEERLWQVGPPPSLQELSSLCGVSVRQLTRAFRMTRGCSVGTFVSDRQIGHARRLIASGRTVADIATTLGFSASSNFCAAFRRATGITPGQYRDSLQRAWVTT